MNSWIHSQNAIELYTQFTDDQSFESISFLCRNETRKDRETWRGRTENVLTNVILYFVVVDRPSKFFKNKLESPPPSPLNVVTTPNLLLTSN
jgi:hypothetical protein